MRVLLTGATSLLGRTTAATLLAAGHEVTVLQRRPSGLPCREVLCDITDTQGVDAAARDQEAVLHLAAKVDVTGPWREFERVNVGGTRAVVEASRRAGVRRLVYVSSPSVAHAGEALEGVAAEPAAPALARSSYARSKGMAEQLALAADGSDLAVVAIRPHLVWGPGDTQLVGRIVERARAGRLVIVGTGAALIDTTVLPNAADALVAALTSPARSEALVVSNGEPRTVREILSRICLAMGVPPPARRVPAPVAKAAGVAVQAMWAGLGRNEPPLTRFLAEQLSTAHWFDQRRTREALGWRPRVTLDEGFRALAASADAT